MRVLVACGDASTAVVEALATAGYRAEPADGRLVDSEQAEIAAYVLELADGSVLPLIREIYRRQRQAPILLVARRELDVEIILEALEAGADGFVAATSAADVIRPLRALLAGEVVVPRNLTAPLVDAVIGRRHNQPRRLHALTATEWRVCERLERGLTTASIALELGLAQPTVRRHIARAIQKLGVGNREELVALVRRARQQSAPSSQ